MIDPPVIIAIAAAGVLLFGAEKLPKLARSAGTAKKEFLAAQLEENSPS